MWQKCPHRDGECSRQMGRHAIYGDHQIECTHVLGGLENGRIVERPQVGMSLTALRIVLKTIPAYARDSEERAEKIERD